MKMGDLRLTLSVRAYSPLCRHFFISSFLCKVVIATDHARSIDFAKDT